MIKVQSLLSRQNSLILRGLAIVFISLHNFLHLKVFGFSGENEMSFSPNNAANFIDALSTGTNIAGEFLSHLGWIGVPVFVFLTGYGTTFTPTKMDNAEKKIYIKRNFLKLFILMMPAIIFFAGLDIIKGDLWPQLLKRVSYCTMFTNLAYPYLKCDPGVYWYFSLTFQFYLLWAIFGRYANCKNIVVWSLILLAGLYGLCILGSPNALSIYRHCFTGWFPVYGIGVCIGTNNNSQIFHTLRNAWVDLLLLAATFVLILIMDRELITWLFIPIISIVLFLIAGQLMLRSHFLSEVFRWLGKYSACIFVCHPIARTIILNFFPQQQNLMVTVVLYIITTLAIALYYNKLYKYLLTRIVK